MIPVFFCAFFFTSRSLSSLSRLLVAGTSSDGSEKQAFQVSLPSMDECWVPLSFVVDCAQGQLEISLWPGMIQVGLSCTQSFWGSRSFAIAKRWDECGSGSVIIELFVVVILVFFFVICPRFPCRESFTPPWDLWSSPRFRRVQGV